MSDTDRLRRILATLAALLLPALAPEPSRAVTTFQGIGFLPGGNDSRGLGVSGDGSVVVGWSHTGTGPQAFRWTGSGGMVGLGTLPGGAGSHAAAASFDGSVIVGRSSIPDGSRTASPRAGC